MDCIDGFCGLTGELSAELGVTDGEVVTVDGVSS